MHYSQKFIDSRYLYSIHFLSFWFKTSMDGRRKYIFMLCVVFTIRNDFQYLFVYQILIFHIHWCMCINSYNFIKQRCQKIINIKEKKRFIELDTQTWYNKHSSENSWTLNRIKNKHKNRSLFRSKCHDRIFMFKSVNYFVSTHIILIRSHYIIIWKE